MTRLFLVLLLLVQLACAAQPATVAKREYSRALFTPAFIRHNVDRMQTATIEGWDWKANELVH